MNEVMPMNVSTLGSMSLVVLFAVLLGTVLMAIYGARTSSRRWIEASIQGIHASAAVAGFASMLIIYAFVSDDFSIQYVQHTSDSSMPLAFKVTAFWGGLDGSLLFWVLLLSIFSSMAVHSNRRRHSEMIAHVVWVLATISLFFVCLLIFLKNPFAPFLLDAPTVGRGLNPLLQNFYMVIHPPCLYLGYVSLSIPFAFGIAALVSGQLDSTWQASVRRWTLVSWIFLTVGLVLGGLWAYEELGWGGYWAWDPVENAGLIPWFTTTAFLHSIMVQERRGMLRRWNVSLVILSFWLSIMGTFMTRSGVVQSVHAFGRDPVMAWTFGVFMIVIAVGGIGLIVWRWRMLRSYADLESALSREFAFLFNNWILLVMAFFVLGSTLWPTVSEWLGTRVTIRPSHFNHYMVPAGLALLLLMGVGPLLAWRRSSQESLQRQFLFPILMGAVGETIVLGYEVWRASRTADLFGVDHEPLGDALLAHVWGLASFGLCAFCLGTFAQEFYRGISVAKKRSGRSVFDAITRLFMRARRRYGGYIIHLGVILMFFGWSGNTYKLEQKEMMVPGDVVQLRGYEIRHAGLRATEDWQKEMITADIEVLRDGKVVSTLHPARWWFFQAPDQPTTEVSRYMAVGEDVYISMQTVSMDSGKTLLRLFINPLVNWIWAGTILMMFGAALCIGTRRPGRAHGGNG